MPVLVEGDKCCGCGACANKCARKAITMEPNEEGFLHPFINSNLCVECGMCEKSCPGISPEIANNEKPVAYVVQHKDDNIRKESTSGGAFTAIAEEVIRRGGVVFGAVMTEDLKVRHEYISSASDLARFRNSKYVQSDICDCYQTAQQLLTDGKYVCFSGTPCQINGLYKYLGKDYERLIAVDVVCKSVPSPLVFQKYVALKKESEGSISDIVFRDKKRGFLYCTMAHYAAHEDRKRFADKYRRGSESDEWLRLFLSGSICRRSCITCHYQTKDRVGDFTLGDIWETNRSDMDDNKGTTLVHIWSNKGKLFFDSIKENIKFEEYPIDKSRGAARVNTIALKSNRDQLFSDARTLSPTQFFGKYAPYNLKVRMKNYVRYALWLLNLQSFIRHIKHLIIHRSK